METFEKIAGREKDLLFQQLIDDRTLVQFQIPELSMDGLTVVRDVRKNWSTHYFLIDMPENFQQKAPQPKTVVIDFEFTGRDKLKYRFRIKGGRSIRGQTWLRMPEKMVKIQKREHYRIKAGVKAKICYASDDARREMTVVNVSEGGALIEFSPSRKEVEKDAVNKVGTYLRGTELVLLFRGNERKIKINRLKIGRVSEDPSTRRRYCALQFFDMGVEEKNKLIRLIYNLQRDFLKKRLPAGR